MKARTKMRSKLDLIALKKQYSFSTLCLLFSVALLSTFAIADGKSLRKFNTNIFHLPVLTLPLVHQNLKNTENQKYNDLSEMNANFQFDYSRKFA